MNNQIDLQLDNIVEEAKKTGSYFVTASIFNKEKEENNLKHYTLQKEFPRDDIVPSVDASLRGMGIKPRPAVATPLVPQIFEPRRPLKIAIISHCHRMPDSYSPGRAIRNQIKMLKHFGHEVVFFTQEGSQLEVGCEMRAVVPKFKREKDIVNEEMKQKFIDVLREHLTADFDLAITHDFFIRDTITYREAVKECGVPIQWLHFARSGIAEPLDFNMENARYVYLNKYDTAVFAQQINVSHDKIRVVYNEKDPSLFFDWHPITQAATNKLRLWEKDIVQTYPICTTRMDAKGIDSVFRAFSELKRLGNKVGLVICNSNGRKRLQEIQNKMEFAASLGLTEEDVLFTSTLANEEYDTASEVPRQVVAQLMQISNLFVFPTIAEVCSHVLLEASISKNLLVLNEDVPSLFDFADKDNVLSFPFTSLQHIHYGSRDDLSFERLAKQINGQLKANKADRQFRRVWRQHNIEMIYREQLEPILYEMIKDGGIVNKEDEIVK